MGRPGVTTLRSAVTFGRLADLGVRGLRLALPVPGDLSGLGGPPEFNLAAVAAGEAVLLYGVAAGLVPQVSQPSGEPAAVRWTWQQTADERLDHLSGPEAARQFRATMRAATEAMTRLAVAGMSAETETALAELRSAGPARLPLPRTFPAAERSLLEQAWWLAAVLDLANRDDGSAQSASELERRADALREVTSTTRQAVVAAVNTTAPRGA